MDLQFNEEKNIATIKLSGELSRDAILGAFDRAVSDGRYADGMGRLWDFRDADLSSLATETIIQMAQYSLGFPSGINDVKVAFVTDKNLEFGLSRVFEMSSKAKTPINVFRSMEEAEAWMAG